MRTQRKRFKPRSKFVKYMRKTRYNKLSALLFLLVSYLSIKYLQDGTVAVMFAPLGLWLFFAREKVVEF